MKPDKALIRLTAFALGLAVGLPCFAQTPEQIEQRLEELRRMDAEAARRRQETLEFQARRKREEYARRWKRYGDEEIDVLKWRQQKDGTWVTEFKVLETEHSGNFVKTRFFGLPTPSADRIWVKVRMPITVGDLSTSLQLDEERLARLNDISTEHRFRQGDWLVVPSLKSRQVKQIAAIDTSELRRTPPLASLPPVQDRAVVRFGDTVVKIAQRYGLTLQELLQLNPGLETARLVVGSQVRVDRSTANGTRMVLGLKPTSNVISWPELPRFDSSLDALVREGVVAPAERDRILGIRMADSLIGVSCTSLMVNRKPADERWGNWTRPEKGSTDEQLLIDRCAARSLPTPK